MSYQIRKTGLVYDELMLNHYCEWDDVYPENPERIKRSFERCQFYDLTDKCVRIPGRFAKESELESCHSVRVKELMNKSETMSLDELKELSSQHEAVYFHAESNKSARFAAGSSVELMDQIVSGRVENGFAIVRPPGHHAMHDDPKGYCYFNNAAIVARQAIEKYGMNRILIVDWDAHHGQATQFQFYDDPRVMYVSLHRYDYGKFWPSLRESDFDYIGDRDGKGYNINIPLNKIGLGNTEYLAAFYNLILPIAFEFKPELVIISAGYDSAIGCAEGRMDVTPACYAHLINALSSLANGRICALLEGGYCLKSLSEGVALSIRALLGLPCPRLEPTGTPDPIFVETISNLVSVLRPHWSCLRNMNDVSTDISMMKYLNEWDDKYRKDVQFIVYDRTVAKKYPIARFQQVYTEDQKKHFDLVIDKLIADTDMHVPASSVYYDESNELSDQAQLSQALESIVSKKVSCGVVKIKQPSSLKSLNCIKSKTLGFKISFDQIEFDFGQESLNFCLGYDSKDILGFKFESSQDSAYIATLLRVIMPISYQYNPDLVVVVVDFQRLPFQTTTLAVILRFLCALAHKNLLLVGLNESLPELDECIRILKLDSTPEVLNWSCSSSSQEVIKRRILDLKSEWNCFQFNNELPAL